MHNVIIIGAGPAGVMCALTASKQSKKVLLIDKNEDIGNKLKLTGGGRCNLTNLKESNDFIKDLPVKNGRFLYSSLNQFGPHDILNYFKGLGLEFKIERDDKVFPKSDHAIDIINVLKAQLKNNKVNVLYQTEVKDIQIMDGYKLVKTTNGNFKSYNVVIATGGKSYPQTGSTGFGYEIANKFSHEVTDLFPTESPIISHDPLINSKLLQGLSFTNVKLSLIDEFNEVVKYHIHDLIITHFGLSGPAALKLSQFIYHFLKKNTIATLQVDFLPEITYESLITDIKNKRVINPHKNVKTIIKSLLPNRLIDYIFNKLMIDDTLKLSDLSNKQLNDIVRMLKEFEIKVHEIKPIQSAFVTGGGVSLKEINPKTMESKIIPGLFFIGEVLDLHGYTGGYNITIALTTGYAAGNNV